MQEDGNEEKAIHCYENALAIDVNFAKSALKLGEIYRKQATPTALVLAQVCNWQAWFRSPRRAYSEADFRPAYALVFCHCQFQILLGSLS